MFKVLAFCPGNKWCFLRSRRRWNAVSCTVVRFWVTAGTLASFVRCSPVSRGNEEFCECHLPFTIFYATFAWSVFLGISIILIIFANGISLWKDTILASVNWIKGMLLKISGTQSLLPWYPGEFHGTWISPHSCTSWFIICRIQSQGFVWYRRKLSWSVRMVLNSRRFPLC